MNSITCIMTMSIISIVTMYNKQFDKYSDHAIDIMTMYNGHYNKYNEQSQL